ncbi:hypothetical protein DSM101010T_32410 [Desulfovibrio subterraneus]|uniref:Uncharacterized protein n=1 Tax=Desulfovibrio subterraneus TaxID=2718620 RepID=A0A7J0BMH2_9BACT|nr:hypothetical protein DSM101010T_32410 [Desulfovibrio subterraneus]
MINLFNIPLIIKKKEPINGRLKNEMVLIFLLLLDNLHFFKEHDDGAYGNEQGH